MQPTGQIGTLVKVKRFPYELSFFGTLEELRDMQEGDLDRSIQMRIMKGALQGQEVDVRVGDIQLPPRRTKSNHLALVTG